MGGGADVGGADEGGAGGVGGTVAVAIGVVGGEDARVLLVLLGTGVGIVGAGCGVEVHAANPSHSPADAIASANRRIALRSNCTPAIARTSARRKNLCRLEV